MRKQEIYDTIINWQIEAGESFLDYFDGDMNAYNIMFWIRGRGYITEENFNKWEEDIKHYNFPPFSVHDFLDEPEDSYGIIEKWEDGIMILAELFSESITYQRRLNTFLEENQ